MKTDKTTTKQDKEIKDRKGSQPAKYYGKDAEGDDMAKSTKQARARHFEKGTKKDDDDPSAYKPAPGDKSAKTKPSKFTLKYKKMYGERKMSFTNFYKDKKMNEDKSDKSLKKKAEASGMSFSILKKVYNRGVAAWRTGHRPGTTPEQWGHARVNSFVTKSSGTWGKADKDLADKVRASKTEQLKEDNVATLKNIVKRKQAMPLKFKDGTMKIDLTTASGLVRSILGGKIKPETMKKLSFVINKGNKSQFLRLVDLMYKK